MELSLNSTFVIPIYDWMINKCHFSGNRLIIYAYIFDRAYNGNGIICVSHSQIARNTNCSRQSVITNLNYLESNGFIIRRRALYYSENEYSINQNAIIENKNAQKLVNKNFVYLMLDEKNNLYKIGYGKNVFHREKTLLSQSPLVRLIFYFDGGRETESYLHNKYSDKRIRGEWFSLLEQDIVDIKSEFSNTIKYT